MPVDMSKYPENWNEIRNSILIRAGGDQFDPVIGSRCEWCGIRNYAVKYVKNDSVRNFDDYGFARQRVTRHNADRNKMREYGRASVVVLTIAHLDDPDPMNCDPDNLAALCQKCHNGYDAPMRLANRRAAARKAKIEAGQLEMGL